MTMAISSSKALETCLEEFKNLIEKVFSLMENFAMGKPLPRICWDETLQDTGASNTGPADKVGSGPNPGDKYLFPESNSIGFLSR